MAAGAVLVIQGTAASRLRVREDTIPGRAFPLRRNRADRHQQNDGTRDEDARAISIHRANEYTVDGRGARMTSSLPRPWLNAYDYWVPAHLNYPRVPLCSILDTTAVEIPDDPATSFFGAVLSFEELKHQSDRLATALARLGIAKGDRVGIMLPNCPQYIIAAFAVFRLARSSSTSIRHTRRVSCSTIAKDSGIRALLTLDTVAPLDRGYSAIRRRIEQIIVTSLASIRRPALRRCRRHVALCRSPRRRLGRRRTRQPADMLGRRCGGAAVHGWHHRCT